VRLVPLRLEGPDGRVEVLGQYPAPDPPHLGAVWGVVCYQGSPVYVVEDLDGTLWLVSDLSDWYNNGHADRMVRDLEEAND
jgi:hypothetical protein